MDKTSVERELSELREQIRYHGRKYYTEDDPERSEEHTSELQSH